MVCQHGRPGKWGWEAATLSLLQSLGAFLEPGAVGSTLGLVEGGKIQVHGGDRAAQAAARG